MLCDDGNLYTTALPYLKQKTHVVGVGEYGGGGLNIHSMFVSFAAGHVKRVLKETEEL